jgi:hypothetical protein
MRQAEHVQMTDLTVVYWRDIPAQVKSGSGRKAVRQELTPRFAEAIDMAAMVAGKRDSDGYLAEWRTGDAITVEGDAEAAIAAKCAALESEWDSVRLSAAVANGGRECPIE